MPGNVFDELTGMAPGNTVTVIGRFPSNEQIARTAARAHLLEMEPVGGELPPYACEKVIPASDIVVITATTLINKTLPRLLELARNAVTIILGPNTPMNDVLFHHGADILAGVRVANPDALIDSVMQGVKRFQKLAGIEAITRRPIV